MTRANLVALVAFAGLLVWVFTLKPEVRTGLQERVLGVFSKVQNAGDKVREAVVPDDAPKRPYKEIAEENASLRLQIAQLEIQSQELDRLLTENSRFRELLDFEQGSVFSLIPSKIIGRETPTWWNTVVINRGYRQNVSVDSPVVTDAGLVGKTILVEANSSVVVLLTDERCRVGAKIAGSKEQGIATGARGATKLSPDLRLRFLSKDADPQPGTKVYTSNAGGLFPSGIAIGEVKEFQKLDLYGEALLRPAVDFGEITYVFVIERKNPPPISDASRTAERVGAAPESNDL